MKAPALIETVRVRGGVAPLWYLHLRRLAASCQALGVPLPRELLTPEGGADRVHRLEVARRGLSVTERELPRAAEAVELLVGRAPHRPYPHKTTDRAQFDRALEEARAAGADDVVLLSDGGYVAECAVWSIFWWEQGRVCAPPLALGVLPGVARARVGELTGGVEERLARLEEILDRSPFVGNAVRGLVPVGRLGGSAIAPDAGLGRLQAGFWA